MHSVFGHFEAPGDPNAETAMDLIEKYLVDSSRERLERIALDGMHYGIRARAYDVLARSGRLLRLDDWSRLTIELLAADDCETRKPLVAELGKLGEVRALPYLQRLAKSRAGCGVGGRDDCHACVRPELERIVAELEAK